LDVANDNRLVTFQATLNPTPSMSSKPEPVTPGTVLYWLGLAVLLIGVVTVIWHVVNPPATLGI